MTALCGGGASAPRALAPGAVYLGGQALEAILVARFGLSAAWATLLTFVGAQSLDVNAMCATDPPSMPTFSALDVAAILAINPLISPGVEQRVIDLITIAAWYTFCECSSTTTPAPPAGPAYPTDAPVVNPPGFIPTLGANPCIELRADAKSPGSLIVGGVDNIHLPNPSSSTVFVDGVVTQVGGTRPAYWEIYANYVFPNGSGTQSPIQHLPASGTPAIQMPAIPAGAVTLGVEFAQPFPYSSSDLLALRVRIFCDGQLPGSGTASSCCPPDPSLLAQINSVLSLVTILQRQTAPFAYIQSTVHSGLTGSGEISVQGLIGALVTVVSHGTNTGVESADPDVLFEAGWFNWGNADGFSTRSLINCSPQISLPAAAGQYTRIGYTLPVGTTISITELVREP